MSGPRKVLATLLATIGVASGTFVGYEHFTHPAGFPEGYSYAVDISYDLLSPQEAQALKTEEVSLVIQALSALPATGIEHPRYRIESLRSASGAGISTAAYLLVGSQHDGSYYVDFARQGVPDDVWDRLLFVAVDVETSGYGSRTVEDALARLDALGKVGVVYTNWHAWVELLGNPPKPVDTLLWNAAWDNSPDIDYSRHPFGGWTEQDLIGEQWSGGTHVGGQFVDRNSFRIDVLSALSSPVSTPTPPSETSTPVPANPTTCDAIRQQGSFASDEIKIWFLTNCLGQQQTCKYSTEAGKDSLSHLLDAYTYETWVPGHEKGFARLTPIDICRIQDIVSSLGVESLE